MQTICQTVCDQHLTSAAVCVDSEYSMPGRPVGSPVGLVMSSSGMSLPPHIDPMYAMASALHPGAMYPRDRSVGHSGPGRHQLQYTGNAVYNEVGGRANPRPRSHGSGQLCSIKIAVLLFAYVHKLILAGKCMQIVC